MNPISKGVAPLTVAVCTHNRPLQLQRLIGSLKADLAQHQIHLLIIDSASTPENAAAIDRLVEQEPWIRLVRMKSAGVSRARNAALEAIETAWIAFLDDDEIPAPGWLAEMCALVERLPADCGICGGNVYPAWPGSQPAIGMRWRNYLSIIDQEGEFDQTAAPRLGIGHSLLRGSAARQVGGFSHALGRVGTSLLSGEESLLVLALTAAGWRIWHSDRIRVSHDISPERLTRAWVLERAYCEGVSSTRMLYLAKNPMLEHLRWQIRLKKVVLRGLEALFGSLCELDLRLAFMRGVEDELREQQSLETSPERTAASVST